VDRVRTGTLASHDVFDGSIGIYKTASIAGTVIRPYTPRVYAASIGAAAIEDHKSLNATVATKTTVARNRGLNLNRGLKATPTRTATNHIRQRTLARK
jgi:hypothetical protein